MVVDDSALMRKLICGVLMKDPELEVVNTAMDGVFALKKIPLARPDVITLDLEMPRMDGLTALRYIVNDYHIPVVLVSSFTTQGGHLTLDALALGAVDFVTKPDNVLSSPHFRGMAMELVQKVKTASRVSVRKLTDAKAPVSRAAAPAADVKQAALTFPAKVVAIGISTGGPNAISFLLPHLPEDFPAAILIVQHMPEGFTRMFADRLDHACRIRVREAQHGDPVLPGTALIAPGDRHLKIAKAGRANIAVLSEGPPVNGHRPSVDVLFDSVSQECGSRAVGVLMTGMGDDGARGLGRIKSSGGYTLAQDEESCVVFGMPRAAIELGNASEVAPLQSIPGLLTSLVNPATRNPPAPAGGSFVSRGRSRY
jgi:two-component system chemotaxis response regulator CheB